MKRTTIVSGLAVLAATVLAAGSPAQAAGTANVRVAHASPNAPRVDVYVDGMRAFANAPFTAITKYAALPAGKHHVQVFPAGAKPTGKAAIDATLTLAPGKSYTVAAVGTLQQIAPLVLVDKNRLPAAGYAKIRVIHASPNAPAVDVAVTGGPVLIHGLKFGQASGYAKVKAGTYNLEVRPAGTMTAVLKLRNVHLMSRTVY